MTRLLVCSILLAVGVAQSAHGEEEEEFSRANTLLFLSDHLSNISESSNLSYEFRKTGALEEGFTDEVKMRVGETSSEGGKPVEMSFFSGERARYVPPVPDAHGNPVIMVFLQYDVNEMNRLTGGPWRHFQKSIKLALAEDADVADVTVPFEGRNVEATKITISPYLLDPERARFETYAGKVYEFILSEEVPGFVHTIRSVVPPAKDAEPVDGAEAPLIEEVLTYRP